MKVRHVILCAICLALTFSSVGCKRMKIAKKNRGGDITGIRGTGLNSDLSGFPLAGRPAEPGDITEGAFDPVSFGYDSTQIESDERFKIEVVAEYLEYNPTSGVIVEGHCDEQGSREYNLALGERRALAVRAYLIGLGVDGSRVQTKSLGEEQPVHFGHDEGAWGANRRAEFILHY